MKQSILALALAMIVGFPLGWLSAMLLTPVLWRLEPVLQMELAGHSGPSDWVFGVVWTVLVTLLFFVFRFLMKAGAEPKK